MADRSGYLQLLAPQPSWSSRPRLLLAACCSLGALVLVAGLAASRREGHAGRLGPPLALFGPGGVPADTRCDQILEQATAALLLARSRAVGAYGVKGKGTVAAFAYGAHTKADTWGSGILDFSIGGKNSGAHGVVSWKGATGAGQELKSKAKLHEVLAVGAAAARLAAETKTKEVTLAATRMLDQCRQLSENSILAATARSGDGQVLDLTFQYVLGQGRDTESTRPQVQEIYWSPKEDATCRVPFAAGRGLPGPSLPARMEPGKTYTFHCHRLRGAGTVDVTVVTDAGPFQVAMPPVAGVVESAGTPRQQEDDSKGEGVEGQRPPAAASRHADAGRIAAELGA